MPITVSICGYALAAAIIFTYVGQSGEYAAAGYGAGTRIEQVVLLPILGINTAIISIIAQNYGAKNFNTEPVDLNLILSSFEDIKMVFLSYSAL